MKRNIAIVTGASRGIGAAIAMKLNSLNYYVIGTSTSGIGDNPGVSKWLKIDFNNYNDFNDLMKQLKKYKNIKILINNAGINIIKNQSLITSDDYNKIHNINLKTPFLLSSEIAKIMSKSGSGRIINISSIWSVISKKNRTLYTTMKSAINGLTRSMAVEWADDNILINSISPGFVNTELTKKSLNLNDIKKLTKQIPLKRFADVEEIAELAIFLSSNKNTYITGQNIIIDGGFTIV